MVMRRARHSPIRVSLTLMLTSIWWVMLPSNIESQDGSSSSVPASVSLSGRVLYSNGTPVSDATVNVRSFSAHQGIMPEDRHTDRKGFFSFQYPAWGSGYLYASKPDQGYPDPTIALYGLREAKSMRLVELVPASKIQGVTLQLDHPLVKVLFRVTDNNSGAPINGATMRVQWFDDPEISLGSSLSSDGLIELLIPEHVVDVEVEAAHFKPWHMQFDGAHLGSRSSVDTPLTVQVRMWSDGISNRDSKPTISFQVKQSSDLKRVDVDPDLAGQSR